MPEAKRIDHVDLRIGVPDFDVPSVVAAFGLDLPGVRERVIHVLGNFPDVPAGRAVAGTTVRPERAPGTLEVLVQVRPVRQVQLGPAWSAFRSDAVHRLRVAEEWMAAQHILVATCTAHHGAGHPGPEPEVLSRTQRDFLADCAGLVVPEGQLTLAGPIRERTLALRRGDLSFRVRRWTARAGGGDGRLDLVDLEARASASDAPFVFPALRSLARQHEVDTEAEVDPILIRCRTWALTYG